MTNNHIIINEYKCLYISNSFDSQDGHCGIPERQFNELEQFVLQNNSQGTQFLIPTHKKGLGKALQAQSYVGVIELKNNITIEILPKIANNNCETREILIKMLRCLRHSPFKNFNSANLNTQKMHLLEIFIQMFLFEVDKLVKKGLKSDYISKQDNSSFLKGKLKINEHLRRNYIHKELFFIEFDEYLQDRVENQLIKTTMQFLYKIASSSASKKRLREFIFVFDDVSISKNPKTDFLKINLCRNMNDYKLVLQWCKLFLNQESFSPFTGQSNVLAILFNMNQIFEDYVAHSLKIENPHVEILTQHSFKSLLEKPRLFALKPDLMLGDDIIADTKWKLIDSTNRASTYNISQSDIYQMYAYGKKYGSKEIWLIYPKNKSFTESIEEIFFFDDSLTLRVLCFDCKNSTIAPKIKV